MNKVLSILLSLTTVSSYAIPDKRQAMYLYEDQHLQRPLTSQGKDGLITTHASKEPRRFVRVMVRNQLVNRVFLVDLDRYIAGVIAHEMSYSWPLEALKAQAIAARSFTLAMQKERKGMSYDVQNSILDQVYEAIDEKNIKYQKVIEAVVSTKNMVLLNAATKKNGPTVVKAYYHSDCGGHTVKAQTIWGIGVDTGVASDPMCEHRVKNEWSFTVAKNNFYKSLLSRSLASNEVAEPLAIKKFNEYTVDIMGRDFSVQKIRESLGFTKIKGSHFTWQESKDSIIFNGKGRGHGVGLCQMGAKEWAQQGLSYKEILDHYYKKTKISIF